jgi:hypothetical protein
MKRIILTLIFTILIISFTQAAIINIDTFPNQELSLTPIETGQTMNPLQKTVSYTADSDGQLTVQLDIQTNFDLLLEMRNKQIIKFRENYHPNENINLVIKPAKKGMPDLIITGFATYNSNKSIIIPAYYSLIICLTIILFINIAFKKNKADDLGEEAEELLEKEELKKVEEKYAKTENNINDTKDEIFKNEKHEEDIEKEPIKEKTEIENEVFKKDEEKLEEEVKKEIMENDNNPPKEEDIDEHIEKEKTEIENEVFKKDEEKLVEEVKKEIVEETENPTPKPTEGQPVPISPEIKKSKILENIKELEKDKN